MKEPEKLIMEKASPGTSAYEEGSAKIIKKKLQEGKKEKFSLFDAMEVMLNHE